MTNTSTSIAVGGEHPGGEHRGDRGADQVVADHHRPWLGLGLGAVGGQLAVLHESGLVTRTRTGRSMRYERASLGGMLAGA